MYKVARVFFVLALLLLGYCVVMLSLHTGWWIAGLLVCAFVYRNRKRVFTSCGSRDWRTLPIWPGCLTLLLGSS